MKNFNRSILSIVLVIALVFCSVIPVYAVGTSGQPTKYSQSYNSGERDVVCTTLNGTSAAAYYANNTYESLSTLGKDALFDALRTLMRSTHKKITSYSDCKNYSDNTDCENEDGRVLLFYTSYSATMSDWISGSTGWNREHVWPQSLGGGNTSNGGADLHHIRPDDNKTNGTRGNLPFGEVTNGSSVPGSSTVNGMSGGTRGGGYFEPHDNVKGDVARICLYVWVRWGSSWGADSITEVFQSVDVLLAWCELDPVDTWEMGRNEVVGKIQGNRNVFIDYPEYAWLIFGREVPDDMITPSGNAQSGSCPHENTELKNVKTATCTESGYTGDVCCKDCGRVVTAGSTLSANGHSWSEWVSGDVNKERKCTVCGATESECLHLHTEIRNQHEPTCTHSGNTGDTYCTDCDTKLFSGKELFAGGHRFTPWEEQDGMNVRTCEKCGITESECLHKSTNVKNAKDATCEAAGYTGDTYCTKCDVRLSVGTAISALGHAWSEWVKDGEITVRTCTVCSKTQVDQSTCSHNNKVTKDAKTATCTEMGYSGDEYCADCDEKLSTGTSLPAIGHSWTDWTNNGNTVSRTCNNCGKIESESLDGDCIHANTEIRNAKEATCTSAGYTGDTYCKECGEKVSKGKNISASGNHEWGGAVPTDTFDKFTRTCTVCSERQDIENFSDFVWQESSETDAELIIAILSKNTFDDLINDLLTRSES